MIDAGVILDWSREHRTLLGIVSFISLLLLIGTIAIIPYFIFRIPEDYLLKKSTKHKDFSLPASPAHIFYLIFKNLLGIALVLIGIIMLVIPGQGVITILMGIMLMNFPGKHRLAIAIARQPTIFKSINWTRAKALHPPLILPPE
jgi:hypothetical protein